MTELGGVAPAGAQIAGFWRRLIAAMADGLILGVPAYFIGIQFFDDLAALGQNGRFIGAAVSLLYFGVLNSSIGNGQTLGKRLLGVRVVGASGETISLPRSLLRSLVLMLPYYLNGFDLTPFVGSDDAQTMTLLGVFASFVVFGLGGAMVYLYIFNRRTRQSLHDLFVESFVVRAPAAGEVSVRVWPVHVAIALGFVGASLALPAFLIPLADTMVPDDTFAALRNIEHDFGDRPNIQRVLASTETVVFSTTSETSTTRYLVITVYLRQRVADVDPIINDVARAVLKRTPDLLGNEQLKVVVVNAFDIGIVQAKNSFVESRTAEDWRKKLDGTGAGKALEVGAKYEDTFTSFLKPVWELLNEVQPRH